jgi:hypothetical protein
MQPVRWTDGTRFSRTAFVCDLIALPMFVVAGMGSHATGSELAVFLRTAVPVVLAWLLVSRFLGTYRPPAFTSLFATWAIAIPLGLVVRALIRGSLGGDDFWVFLGVAMAFTLLFLGVARGVALALARPWRSA